MTAGTTSITVSGPDRAGISHELLAMLSPDARVLDLEQVVVQGHLTLCVLVDRAVDERGLRAWADAEQLDLQTRSGAGDNASRAPGRAYVVVLASSLHADTAAAVTQRIRDTGANIDRIRRLARTPVTAIEFDVSGADVQPLRRELALVSTQFGVDIAVAPGGLARRGRRLLVMDVDSTLIQDEVIELIAQHAGSQEQVAAVTERAMRGELDFTESLHARVATLAGLDATVLDQVRAEIRLTPGARTLIRTLKALGYTIGVVSGGFIEIVGPLAQDLGIDFAHANRLQVADGRLTGRVDGPVVDRAEKERSLRRWAQLVGLPMERTVAVGDGANDLDMLAAAGLGVAFNAKPVVRAQAHTSVSVPFLDPILFMLGITRDEVEAADITAGAPSRQPDVSLESGHA